MIRKLCWLLAGLFWLPTAHAQSLPMVVAGKIVRLDSLESRFVEKRTVDIWLPPGYDGRRKFAVLYLHDGQMLFDATTTWNHQAWDVDDVASRLAASGQLATNFIVVGIWNAGARRHHNYLPQRPYDRLTTAQRDTVTAQLQAKGRTTEPFQPNSDAYLRFIVEELKPLIDQRFAVYRDRRHTLVAGSSMGGLISLYALCEYPRVFGGAACLSTHWPGTFTLRNNPLPDAFLAYLREKLPPAATHRLYFDCGDQTLDALYPAIQRRADEVLRATGYGPRRAVTRYFPGQDHSEKAWKARLDQPLLFLFGTRRAQQHAGLR